MNLFTSFQAERLLAQLRNQPDLASAEAKKVLQKLAKLGPKGIPNLLDALAESGNAQTEALVELLTRLTNDRTLHLVARGLASDEPRIVKGAAKALSAGNRYNINQLVNMLGEDGYSKPSIIEILMIHKDRLNVGRLLATVSHLEPSEQNAVFRIIGEIATEENVPDLLARMTGRDAQLKTHLVEIVARFERPDVTNALRELLRDSNKLVRRAALDGIASTGGSVGVDVVCELLLDADLDVMNRAVEVIVKMNHPDTVKHLLAALKSENEFSRRAAVEVLNEIGTTASVKYLLEAVADDDWWVRSRASDALARIGGPRVIDAVLELIKDKDENVRRAAIEIINTCGDKSTVDQLIEATKDSDWWVSERAADALAGIGDQRAVPALLEMLGRNDRSLPVAIAALGRLGDLSVLKQLLPFARRPEKEISVAAINAVADLADERYADGVRTFLEKGIASGSPDDTIARAAAKAIKKLDGKLTLGTHRLSGNLRGVGTETSGDVSSQIGRSADARRDAMEDVNSTVRTLLSEGLDADDLESSGVTKADTPVLDISTLEAGDIIDGRYKFIQKIGKGAFGTVLLVEDTVVEERLILKFLNPNVASDEEMMKRFVHELRYSRRITHKNVIRIYDFLYIGGGYAISMEYFPSHTLGAEIGGEPMPVGKALNYAHDICVGMHIAHQQGIIHRDLKPANILINDDGLLKIVDFGVAAAAKSGDTQLTKTGYVIGSPKYMAPEQILGKKVDERADVYSLGVILYEMLCGAPPYSRGDHMSVMYQHVQGKAKPLSEIKSDIPEELSEIVAKAMMVDKAKRYTSMVEFQDALAAAAKALA